MKILLDIKCE